MRRSVVCALLVLALALTAQAADPAPGGASRPALVLNDPFAAALWRIDVDADERFLVAGSPAKAAAIWSLETFDEPDLARLPLRDEEMQRAHAIAIAPDGRRVAAAVPPLRDAATGFAMPGTAVIYILDRASRRIEAKIEGLATRPQALRFSPDGAMLAASLSDGCGLRVWSAADWRLVGSDDDGYAGSSGSCCPAAPDASVQPADCDPFPDTPGLAWGAAQGALFVVTSGDTGVRLYKTSPSGVDRVAAKSPADLGLDRPEGIAVSPDATRLAVADARVRGKSAEVKLQVAILDLATLEPKQAPLTLPPRAVLSPALLDAGQTPGADQMALNRVAWMANDGGDLIYAGGLAWCQIADPGLILGQAEASGAENCVVRWRLPAASSGEADVQFVRAGVDRVMDLAALPKRNAVAVATLQRITALNEDGTVHVNDAGRDIFAAARAFDFRDRPLDRAAQKMLAFDISPDASKIYIEDYRSTTQGPVAVRFDVDQLKLEAGGARPPEVAPPDRDPMLVDALANWWNAGKPPVLYGSPLTPLQGVRDTYRAVALAPQKRAVVGSSTHVRVVGYDGGQAKILCQARVAAEAYRVAVSADSSLAVVGHSDGTLRWYRIAAETKGSDTCTLTPLLAVHIRQSDDGAGWTWSAWQPETGKFAADPRAKDLLGWQVMGPSSQVDTVRFADVLQLYAPDAVKASLRELIPAPAAVVARLEKSIGDAVDPLRLLILSPDPNADIETETVRFDLKVDGGTAWPRDLFVTNGSGTRLAKVVGDEQRAGNEPLRLAAPGIVQVAVKLPAADRQQHGNVDVCFLVDRQRDCQTVNWNGTLEKPPPRALHAVIVGLSAYKDPNLVLNFAQNDALDLARIFVRDYKARVADKTSSVAPDYQTVSIDLVVAATSPAVKAEIADLEASGIVRSHDASIANITSVLAQLAGRVKNENDLVLFYFSGHGLLNPYRDAKGLTALLGPDIESSYSRENIETNSLSSDRLITLLEAAPGEKLVIIDACRTTASIAGERAFDPAAVRLEFERNLLSADFFFSAAPGQYSLDQGELAFSADRAQGERGNGLFTYALLKSLTDAAPGMGAKPRKVEVYDVDRYVRGFFDGSDAESAATRLVRRLAEQGVAVSLQQPVFVPARRRAASATVIRTLDPGP